MKYLIIVMLLTAGTTFANTHVNISYSSHSSKMTESRNNPVQLKATDCLDENNNGEPERFARIKAEDKKENIDKLVGDFKTNHDSNVDYQSTNEQREGNSGYISSQSHNQRGVFYNSNTGVHQNIGQIRNVSPQDRQNMEFERYIQNYHSGPTVETVYESAKPQMQHNLKSSSVPESPQRVVKFERQVALPTKVDSVQISSESNTKPIVNHQHVDPSNTPVMLVSSSSSSSSSSHSSSPSVPNDSSSSSNSKDGTNFDLSYNKPNYNDPIYKYNDGHSDAHFYNQPPPPVEQPQRGYGGYSGHSYNRQQVTDGYHTVEQRPVVTKTIQIAQPAIKAKKYEVRHPAIQKEFYDIEERVVIKPAGTVVVELERPSAKILKEETTLPLGHPHPAVASAYMPSRNTQSFSNIVYSNTGSETNHHNNQYIPHQSSQTYDQSRKDVVADSNQNKPSIGENHYSTVTTGAIKTPNREIVVVTDGSGNQRQISRDQLTFSRDETDNAHSRPVYNRGNSYVYENSRRANSQINGAQERSALPPNRDNREELDFGSEYINNSGKSNFRKESKPARLQEQSSRVIESSQQTQPIIKHEHKIVLSPSQHNIYLSRNQEMPQINYNKETVEVHENKPHFQNQREPIMVYASAKQTPEIKYIQSPSRMSSQVVQYRGSPQIRQSNVVENRVQYSAPYAQMRHNSHDERNKNEQQQGHKTITNYPKSEKLVVEDKSEKNSKNQSVTNTMDNQAHFEIKIPNHSSHDSDKAIVVSSTIRPMMMNDDQTHHAKLEISVTNNGEPQEQQILNDDIHKNEKSIINNDNENDSDIIENEKLRANPNCDETVKSAPSEDYNLAPDYNNNYSQQKFMRIEEETSAVSKLSGNEGQLAAESGAIPTNLQHHNVDVNVKSTAGNVSPPGRVIASTPAPKELTPRESFHKRRIVVNHPFQTVREVVEHEPYTNYHEVQVNEPATPALYHSANYYQSESRHSNYN